MNKRLTAAAAVLFVVLASAGAVFVSNDASAASKGKDTALAGTAEWSYTATTVLGTFKGPLGTGTYAGTLNLGDSFYYGDGVCLNAPYCQVVTGGTIAFSSKRGDFTAAVEPGSLADQFISHPRDQWQYYTLDLTVVAGTRSYQNADGAMTLSYSSHLVRELDYEAGVYVTTITDTGTLSGNPR